MDWTPIVVDKKALLFSEKIDDIARTICHSPREYSPGLMYGEIGPLLFRFNYCAWKGDEEMYVRTVKSLPPILKQTRTKAYYGSSKTDLSFATGQSGIHWAICYLANNGFVGADLDDIFGHGDAPIFRSMIEMVQEPKLSDLNKAVEIGLYAVNRGSRLSHEFLRRFIRELSERTNELEIREKIVVRKPDTPGGIIRLLNKILKRYPDIEHVPELLAFFLALCADIPPEKHDLKTLLVMVMMNSCRDRTSKEVDSRAEMILNNSDYLKVDAGLAGGLAATAHGFNRIFQVTGNPLHKETSVACFEALLNNAIEAHASVNALWYTASRGLWGQHSGLLNGLSGIGLALMAAVSGEEPAWDEILFFS